MYLMYSFSEMYFFKNIDFDFNFSNGSVPKYQ